MTLTKAAPTGAPAGRAIGPNRRRSRRRGPHRHQPAAVAPITAAVTPTSAVQCPQHLHASSARATLDSAWFLRADFNRGMRRWWCGPARVLSCFFSLLELPRLGM